MRNQILSEADLALLKGLGDALIPARAAMPGFSAVAEIDRLLQVAAAACGTTPSALRPMLDALPPIRDLAAAEALSQAMPQAFATLSGLISGAYYMSREVLAALNYPLERSHPAGMSDFADEYMTGILDPVTDNRRGAP